MLSKLRKGLGKVLRSPESAFESSRPPTYFDYLADFDEFLDNTDLPESILKLQHPPTDYGLPVKVSTPQLLRKHERLVENMDFHIKITPEEFRRFLLPVIGRFARHVHLLPASESHHHRGPGGLLHHSLEVAYHALRRCHDISFTRDAFSTKRRALDQRWQVAAFLVGLGHDIGKTVTNYIVTDEAGENPWRPHTESLGQWSKRVGSERYFVKWKTGRGMSHERSNAPLMAQLIQPELLHWLAEYGPEILIRLNETLSYTETDHPFAQMIMRADSRSVSDDMSSRTVHTKAIDGGWGGGVSVLVLDTMSSLINEGTWKINEKGARVWLLQEGVFIVWSRAVQEVRELLVKDGVRPLPRHPDFFAEQLVDEKVADPFIIGSNKTPYWHISPDIMTTPDGKRIWLKCLKVATPNMIFKTIVPPDVLPGLVRYDSDRTAPEPRGPQTAFEEPAKPIADVEIIKHEPMSNLDDLVASATANPASKPRASVAKEQEGRNKVVEANIALPVQRESRPKEASETNHTHSRSHECSTPQIHVPMFAVDSMIDDPFYIDTLVLSPEPGTDQGPSRAPAQSDPRIEGQLTPNSPASRRVVTPSVAVAKNDALEKKPLATRFGKEPEVVTLLDEAILAEVLLQDQKGRVFLPASFSKMSKEMAQTLSKNGWLWRSPDRPTLAATFLGGAVGYTFDTFSSKAILQTAGPGKIPKGGECTSEPNVDGAAPPAEAMGDGRKNSRENDRRAKAHAPPADATAKVTAKDEHPPGATRRRRKKTVVKAIKSAHGVVGQVIAATTAKNDGNLKTYYVNRTKLCEILDENEMSRLDLIKEASKQGFIVRPYLSGMLIHADKNIERERENERQLYL